jgi:alpha-glucoside transport system substrate-binding protein
MRSKALSLFVLLLVGVILAACGGGAAQNPTTAPAGEATTAPAAAATEPAAAATEPAAEATEPAAEATEPAAEATEPAASGPAASGTTDYAAISDELAAAFNREYEGTTVSLLHGLSGEEEIRFQAVFEPFQEATGITVNLVPGSSTETIAVKVEGGTVEDIVNFPQPGDMSRYARQSKVIDLNQFLKPEWLAENYNQGFIDTNTVPDASGNEILGGVFQRINFKSAVWYPKAAFDEAGYTVPETWDEMLALMDTIVADGDAPWCIGIESGGATGWPATDWIEEIMLRTTSLENYDAWTRGELEFTSPEVRNAMDVLTNIWFNDQYVYGGRQAIVTTNFGDSPTPMFDDPPKCWLHRQGNFITTFFEENAPGVEPGVDYDFFYLPPIDEQYGEPVLFAGDLFSMFNDRPEVRAVISYFTTYESIQPWIQLGGGALSPHQNSNLDDYRSDIERRMAETILNASSARFDGSDLMPGEVGAGSFWKGMTDYVSGSADLDEALQTMQDGWANVPQ